MAEGRRVGRVEGSYELGKLWVVSENFMDCTERLRIILNGKADKVNHKKKF